MICKSLILLWLYLLRHNNCFNCCCPGKKMQFINWTHIGLNEEEFLCISWHWAEVKHYLNVSVHKSVIKGKIWVWGEWIINALFLQGGSERSADCVGNRNWSGETAVGVSKKITWANTHCNQTQTLHRLNHIIFHTLYFVVAFILFFLMSRLVWYSL